MIAGHFPFWMAEEEGRVLGVMGIQDRGAVAMVRRDVRRVNDPEEGVERSSCAMSEVSRTSRS